MTDEQDGTTSTPPVYSRTEYIYRGACLETFNGKFFITEMIEGFQTEFRAIVSEETEEPIVQPGEEVPGARTPFNTVILTASGASLQSIRFDILRVLAGPHQADEFYCRDPDTERELRAWLAGVKLTPADGSDPIPGEELAKRIKAGPPPWSVDLERLLGVVVKPATIAPAPTRRRERLPCNIPQPTFQEARNMAMALHDAGLAAPDRDRPARNWHIVPLADGDAAVWSRPRDAVQVRLEPATSTIWGLDIRECLARLGGRKSALATWIVLSRLLEEDTTPIWFDELIDLLHLPTRDSRGNRRQNARDEHRQWLWSLAQTWQQTVVVGARRGTYTRDGKAIEIESDAPLILLDERLWDRRRRTHQLSFDGGVPDGVVVKRGSLLERFAGDPRILPFFGNLRLLAELPTGKPIPTLAQTVGLALHQLWREKAARCAGRMVTVRRKKVPEAFVFTRRELCEEFPDDPPDWLLRLADERPRRAREYWDGAMKLLQTNARGEVVPGEALGTIGTYAELDPTPKPKPGEPWPARWWYGEQRLLIAPTEEQGALLEHVQTVQLKRLPSRRRTRTARAACG